MHDWVVALFEYIIGLKSVNFLYTSIEKIYDLSGAIFPKNKALKTSCTEEFLWVEMLSEYNWEGYTFPNQERDLLRKKQNFCGSVCN